MVNFAGDPVALTFDLKHESNSDRDRHHAQWTINKNLYLGNHWNTSPNPGQNHLTVNLIRNAVHGMLSAMTDSAPKTNITPLETDVPGMYFLKPNIGPKLKNMLEFVEQAGEAGKAFAQLKQKEQFQDLTIGEQVELARLENTNKIDPATIPEDVMNVASGLTDEHFVGEVPLLPEQFDAFRDNQNPLTEQPFLDEDDAFLINDISTADLLERVLDSSWNRFSWDRKIQETQLDTLIVGHRDMIVEYDDSLNDVQIHKVLEKDSWIDPDPNVTDIADAHHYQYAQVMDINVAIRKFPQFEAQFRRHAEDPSSAQDQGESLSDRYTDIDWRREMVVLYTTWIRDQKMDKSVIVDDKGMKTVKKLEEPVFGLREIRVVGGQLLFDGPSRYRDIPAIRLKFITIIDSSYSVGLPEHLEDLQRSFNTVFSNLSDHTKYLPQPIVWGEKETIKRAFENKTAPFANATNMVGVDLAMMERDLGNPLNVLDTPSLNPSYVGFLQMILNIFHDLSNQGDVIRGVASSKAESGKAIESLQSAANRLLTLGSQWMDYAIARLQKLAYQHMLDFMPIERWAQYTDKYPQNVLEAIVNRAQNAQFNVRVETAGTRLQKRAAKQQKAILMRERNAMSLETFLAHMEVENPKEEARKIIGEQSAIAQAQSQAALQEKQVEAQTELAIEQAKTDRELKKVALEQSLEGERELALERLRQEDTKQETAA